MSSYIRPGETMLKVWAHGGDDCILHKRDLESVSWDGKRTRYSVRELNWFEQLDYAVYHAAGWEHWQAYRESLKGSPLRNRANSLRWWWENHNDINEELYFLNLIRVTNATRSLRGQHKEYPDIADLCNELAPKIVEIRLNLLERKLGELVDQKLFGDGTKIWCGCVGSNAPEYAKIDPTEPIDFLNGFPL